MEIIRINPGNLHAEALINSAYWESVVPFYFEARIPEQDSGQVHQAEVHLFLGGTIASVSAAKSILVWALRPKSFNGGS